MRSTKLLLAAFLIAALLLTGAARPAEARPSKHRAVCAPVYIEGAGTVRICAPVRGR